MVCLQSYSEYSLQITMDNAIEMQSAMRKRKINLIALHINRRNKLLNEILIIDNSINAKKLKQKRLKRKKLKLKVAIIHEFQKIVNNIYLDPKIEEPAIQEKQSHNTFFENELFNNGEMFFKENMRMNIDSFDELCLLLCELNKAPNHLNESICLKKRIAVALYALGSAVEYRIIGQMFGIDKCTVDEIVLDFCNEVWKEMRKTYLNAYPLNNTVIEKNIKAFKEMGFPQCIGAIDGCHIEVKPHEDDANNYYNYRGVYSTVLLAVVDQEYNFMYINVGCPGKCNYSEIYEQSSLKTYNERNDIFQRYTKIINSVKVQPLLLGNSAFGLSKHITKPFSYRIRENHVSEKRFNFRLSKCSRVVKIAFNRLKARFMRFDNGKDNHIDNIKIMIKACCVLNNFLNNKRDDVNLRWLQQLQEQQNYQNYSPLDATVSLNSRDGVKIRNAISSYFAMEDSASASSSLK